jgi:hypothetical protein
MLPSMGVVEDAVVVAGVIRGSFKMDKITLAVKLKNIVTIAIIVNLGAMIEALTGEGEIDVMVDVVVEESLVAVAVETLDADVETLVVDVVEVITINSKVHVIDVVTKVTNR